MPRIEITFVLKGSNINEGTCYVLTPFSEHKLKYYDNHGCEGTFTFDINMFSTFYYKYYMIKDNLEKKTESCKYRSIVFDFKNLEYYQFVVICIFDEWDDLKSSYNPVIRPILLYGRPFLYLITPKRKNCTISHYQPISVEVNHKFYTFSAPRDYCEFYHEIKDYYYLENSYFEMRSRHRDTNMFYFSKIHFGLFKQRYASIYLPLISFKSRKDGCDVGTFSSVKGLVDFCNNCGIYQILLDIEKVNDDLTIDPIHYDCKFNANELISYDIDSIRAEKLKILKEEYVIFEKNILKNTYLNIDNIRETQKKSFEEFVQFYSKYIKEEEANNTFLLFVQFKCYSQLQDAFLYACQRNINIATVVYNDDNVSKKVDLVSKYSHSVYICNTDKKNINIGLYRGINNSNLSVMIDSSIAESTKENNFSFFYPNSFKTIPEHKSNVIVTHWGPDSLEASMVSEFSPDMKADDIRYVIEDRVFSEADISIFYLTDLLYITLPGAERDIHQPLQGKLDETSEYWRYLYNLSLDILMNDECVIKKTKELLKNGNRYYKKCI